LYGLPQALQPNENQHLKTDHKYVHSHSCTVTMTSVCITVKAEMCRQTFPCEELYSVKSFEACLRVL